MRTGFAIAGLAVLAGCAAPRPPVVVATAPPPVSLAPELPPGATPGMLVPQPLADGSFPTPNRQLFGDAALWHLRSGLNVAALSCGGTEGAQIRAAYNSWLTRDRKELAVVQKRYAAGYPGGEPAYDEAMTRLYNYFSQTPVRGGLCAAAASIAADLATDAGTPDFAETRLAMLDRPYTAFYAAYDAWRTGMRPATASEPPAVIAVAAPVAAAPVASAPALAAATRTTPRAPRTTALTLDLSSLPVDSEVTAPR